MEQNNSQYFADIISAQAERNIVRLIFICSLQTIALILMALRKR